MTAAPTKLQNSFKWCPMSNHKISKFFVGLIGGGVVLVASATIPSWAVQTVVDGHYYDLPAGADKNIDAVRTLIAASDALGMTRRGYGCPGANLNCLGLITASHKYRASGTWNGSKADLV